MTADQDTLWKLTNQNGSASWYLLDSMGNSPLHLNSADMWSNLIGSIMTILHGCVWDNHGLASTTSDLHLTDETIPFDPTPYRDDPILINYTPPASLSN